MYFTVWNLKTQSLSQFQKQWVSGLYFLFKIQDGSFAIREEVSGESLPTKLLFFLIN